MIPSSSRAFVEGMGRAVPIVISVAPFAVLFGALATSHGLSVVETVAMSATIYAGASQMVGIGLFGGAVAPWLIVVSIFAVNFRHVLYSAVSGRKLGALSRLEKAVAFFFLVDPQFAETEKRAEAGRPVTFSWYMGAALPVYLSWVALTLVGALTGRFVAHPEAYGVDFLLPLYFMGLVVDFRDRPNWVPVVVSSAVAAIVACRVVGSPWHVSIGALAGVAVAALMPVRGAAAADDAQVQG